MSRAGLAICSFAVVAAGVGAALATSAAGEVAESGSLIAMVEGEIKPRKLPRDRRAPVSMRVSTRFETTDGSDVPPLRRAVIELNRHGKLHTRGLGNCREPRIRNVSTFRARKRCGKSIVGRGRVATVINFPDMEPLALEGRMLAFNSRRKKGPSILTHTFVSDPAPVTFALGFKVKKKRNGPYGMRLVADFPKIARDQGHVTAFAIKLGRRFKHRGVRRSYLSAACGVPKGLNVALFPLARTTFIFADGRQLSTTLERVCRVRR